jgi:hypothetical protein
MYTLQVILSEASKEMAISWAEENAQRLTTTEWLAFVKAKPTGINPAFFTLLSDPNTKVITLLQTPDRREVQAKSVMAEQTFADMRFHCIRINRPPKA